LAITTQPAPGSTKPQVAYVTGVVSIDGPQLKILREQALSGTGNPRGAALVLLHELGHLVGLDHVEEPSQVMYPSIGDQADMGVGDRYGLAALGSARCVPEF
jgi:predicted Zn-dependent protease